MGATREPKDEDELPALPPLVGDDEPLGDDAGVLALDEGEGTLDDAAAAELVLDVEFDESDVGAEVAEDPLFLGADDDGLVIDESTDAMDESTLDDRSIPNDLDVPDLVEDRGDRGDEGPLGEVTELGALPPLDDDDDDAPRAPPVARAPVTSAPRAPLATFTRVDVEGVVAAAVEGERLFLLAGDVYGLSVDPQRVDDIELIDTPDATGCALALDARGALLVATIEGVVRRRGASGGWRPLDAQGGVVRALLGDGARVWARTLDGALLRAEGNALARAGEFERVGAWAADGVGGVAVFDASARGALCVSLDGGPWRSVELPRGVTPSRVALRGDALAVVDAVTHAAWVRVEGEAWSMLPVKGCSAVALVGTDDGRTFLLAASLDARPGYVTLSRVDCDGDLSAAETLAALRRADDGDDRVELLAIGRGGALCALVADGAAYVVALADGTRLRS